MDIDKKYLIGALKEVSLALGSNNLVPVFQSFVFANDVLTATDGTLGIRKQLDVDTGLKCCVQGLPLIKLLDGLKQKTVDIDYEDSVLYIGTKEVVGGFRLTEGDFIVKHFDCEHELDLSLFIASLGSCLYGASDDETQDVLCGVHVEKDYLYSTDRFRIVRTPITLPEECKELIGLTLPIKFVKVLVGMDERKFTGFTKSDSKLVLFSGEKFSISSTLLVGDYPELAPFFLDNASILKESVPLVFPDSIVEVLDRHISFQVSRESFDKELVVEVDKDQVLFMTKDPIVGYLDEKIKLEEGIGIKLTFIINPLFFKDIIKKNSIMFFFEERKYILIQSESFEAVVKVRA